MCGNHLNVKQPDKTFLQLRFIIAAAVWAEALEEYSVPTLQ
jgi:hypothetical protein